MLNLLYCDSQYFLQETTLEGELEDVLDELLQRDNPNAEDQVLGELIVNRPPRGM